MYGFSRSCRGTFQPLMNYIVWNQLPSSDPTLYETINNDQFSGRWWWRRCDSSSSNSSNKNNFVQLHPQRVDFLTYSIFVRILMRILFNEGGLKLFTTPVRVFDGITTDKVLKFDGSLGGTTGLFHDTEGQYLVGFSLQFDCHPVLDIGRIDRNIKWWWRWWRWQCSSSREGWVGAECCQCRRCGQK